MHAPHMTRKARISLTVLGVFAAGVWVLYAACAFALRSENGEDIARAAAVTATLSWIIALATMKLSAVVWTAAANVRDRHAALVLRTLADVTRPSDRKKTTVPLQVVRELPRPARGEWPR